jgi:ketopantoate reductase
MFKHIIVKLKSYGINGKLLKWLKDYISERKQQVLLNNSISSLGTLKAGVPQGSVLDPLLFLLYINDTAGYANFMIQFN